ncbi:MAG: hypothetical protein MJE77_23330 [Proteobacteria bacterium]|nr:hypothetical protein [Pseudomonadota bacterium]
MTPGKRPATSAGQRARAYPAPGRHARACAPHPAPWRAQRGPRRARTARRVTTMYRNVLASFHNIVYDPFFGIAQCNDCLPDSLIPLAIYEMHYM